MAAMVAEKVTAYDTGVELFLDAGDEFEVVVSIPALHSSVVWRFQRLWNVHQWCVTPSTSLVGVPVPLFEISMEQHQTCYPC